jgi:hypothetical protein
MNCKPREKGVSVCLWLPSPLLAQIALKKVAQSGSCHVPLGEEREREREREREKKRERERERETRFHTYSGAKRERGNTKVSRKREKKRHTEKRIVIFICLGGRGWWSRFEWELKF